MFSDCDFTKNSKYRSRANKLLMVFPYANDQHD